MATDKQNPDVAVTCSHCTFEITFSKPGRVAQEFSLLCPDCGRRKIYPVAAIHAPGKKSKVIDDR
jgi:hypothetical protein